MDSPCSVTRRQAWAQCSRQWLTVEDTELQTSGTQNSPATQLQDEILTNNRSQSSANECSTGKIETWLQSCGHEVGRDNPVQPTVESFLKAGNSFEDDLGLGAEAIAPSDVFQDKEFGQCPLLLPPPKSRKHFHASNTSQQRSNLPLRNMGQSMASSVISSQSKTFSSVTEVLQMCADDAEETLYQLGFGCEEPQVTARIPARFFNFPSKLKGINFRLFLESQLQRIREEDPNLSLASRFRQVEVLTAMANAFYSLYSHVSRTPVQKLAPPEFSFSSPTVERSIGQRFFGTVRNEPRSPVERLKDTVSKMCLYTGSRASESGSPSCSPRKRNSLPDVVEIVMGNVRGEGSHDRRRGSLLQDQAGAINMPQSTKDVKMPLLSELKPAEKVSEHENINDAHKKRIQRWSQSGQRESPRVKACLFRFEQAAVESVQSHKSKCDTDRDKGLDDTSSYYSAGAKTPVIHHASCPQVIDFVHRASCSCPQRDSMATLGTPPATQMQQVDSSFRTFESKQETVIPGTQPEICLLSGSQDEFSVKQPLISKISQHNLVTQGSTCQITVTGWEDDAPVSHRDSVEDYRQSMYSDSTAHIHSSLSINQQFLSPVKSSSIQINDVPKQANSFELEEVQSVGEEENISAEHSSAHTLSVTASTHQTCCPLRGDSFQSDSSGYVEEDMQQPFTNTTTTQKEVS